jgi:hypothetical protein
MRAATARATFNGSPAEVHNQLALPQCAAADEVDDCQKRDGSDSFLTTVRPIISAYEGPDTPLRYSCRVKQGVFEWGSPAATSGTIAALRRDTD